MRQQYRVLIPSSVYGERAERGTIVSIEPEVADNAPGHFEPLEVAVKEQDESAEVAQETEEVEPQEVEVSEKP